MPAIVIQVKKAERTMESPREQSTVHYVNTTKEYTHPKPVSNPISSLVIVVVFYCTKKEQT